ncbi:NADH-quinone oxidoreductase subunit NuoN [Polymorphobacter fuscus]|uniref:NADH-quinone oxidoreductase subunit N n=1 Tax=Sandarakinorhabdus fusca TaxID=1439888 RepID=A0A7C9KGX7_9SPHN|nr:NADH-quinone oxidoreductase subunit NuoN [Polymorphobacter fuscus]KAB7648402.1 NADH-quinone oxidoreductase subunit NuoN [Polymorphobacter fuscus]MQT15919.1 NADH-quinone oxidoreductase subunit NuoN [Polymorphobacter fuscus]NJC07805.1 NADH-quinone oxidoreductase subunit N [Polymorphobacter fuscus]
MNPTFVSILTAGPELVLTTGSLLTLMLGTFLGQDKALRPLTYVAVGILGIAGWAVLQAPAATVIAFDGLYITDSFSTFLKVLILAAAAASMLLALPYLDDSRTGRFEYPVLLMLATLGMCMMVSANDLLSLYVGLELQSLAAYVLAAFHRGESRSSEAGLKYFVLGALASGILLYGITLVYGFAGATGFDAIHQVLAGQGERSLGVLLGLVFILSGLAFKISAVPFHMWTPDVYEGAPTPVAAFFSAAPKAAAIGLMVRVLVGAFGPMAIDWQQIVVFLSIASMLLGAVGAIGQTNVKRLLAYSSIANIGFALVGLAAASPQGVEALLFYVAIYLAMTLGSFLVILQLRRANGAQVELMSDLSGLSKVRPGLAAALAIFMFSLAGIPPLLGFWPKFAVFQAAIAAGMVPLALLGFVASVVAAYYYLRLVKIMYFDEPGVPVVSDGGRINGAMIAAAAVFCSPLGMLTMTPIVAAAGRAAASLFLR